MKFAVPLMAVACLSSQVSRASPQSSQDCFERLTAFAIERPRLPGSWIAHPQFDVSPDGHDLVYVERTASTAYNEIKDILWSSEADKPEQRHLVALLQTGPSSVELAPSNPSFAPNGLAIAVLGGPAPGGISIFSRSAGADRKLVIPGEAIVDFRWSPNGKYIAALTSKEVDSVEREGFDAPRNWDGHSFVLHHQAIVVIDVASGGVIARTPHQYQVAGLDSAFSWSPDGRHIALSAEVTAGDGVNDWDTDLFIFDVVAQEMESLILRPGPDLDPQWSPDGKSIAYLTGGLDVLKAGFSLTIHHLDDNTERVLPRADLHTGSPYQARWIDASHLTYVAMREMACPAFLVDSVSGSTRVLADDGLSCFGGTRSGRGSRIFLSRQSLGSPGQIVSTDIDRPNLRALNPQYNRPSPWRVEKVSWESGNGDYTVHGVLIRPPDFARGGPLLISIPGGPGMVSPDSYNDDAMFLPYGPLLGGFAILVVNTRGRGGYGHEFEASIRESKDYMAGPLSDVTAAVDFAVKTLGVSRGSIALAGFSYGGILATYAAGNTAKFKVVMAMEGVVDFYSRALMEYGGPNQRAGDDNMGFSNPYDEGDRRRLMIQSPLWFADTVRAPILLECGANSLGPSDCLKYFRTANARSAAPVNLTVYPRTSHMLSEPALRFDSAKRQSAWLKRWIPLQSNAAASQKACYEIGDQ